MTADTATAGCETKHTWPPGFRFHPTDEELVLYYLKRKICRKRLKLDIIGETDVYKWDPEELPGQSKLRSGDRQWFFFSPRDRRYPNGARSNRATQRGYWKATGKDRSIICNARTVGVKKTLVYYTGRAPIGGRTDWVMHEYTLDEEELKRCQTAGDYYALYKVYKKSGPGPKNGEQYGAPFKEEDWADDEFLDVNNCFLDQDHTSKKFNEIVSVDKLKVSNQVQSTLIDIDEFLNQDVDQSAVPQPPIIDPALSLPQVYDELPPADISFNGTNFTERSVVLHPNSQQYGVGASFVFTKSTTHVAQFIDTQEVTSTPNIFEEDFNLTEEDFLEIDDLICQEPISVNPSKPIENLQFDEIDGLSEFDLFNDASMFVSDLGSIDQGTVSDAYMNNFENHMMNQSDNQLGGVTGQLNSQLWTHETVSDAFMNNFENHMTNQSDNQLCDVTGQLSSQPWTHELTSDCLFQEELNTGAIYLPNSGGAVYENNSTNISTETNQNQIGQIDDIDQNWFTSALWSFVESIPTTPASASESALVNRAFERLSSFNRVKVNATTSTNITAKKASKNRVFFLVSVIVVLFAIFWVLMKGKTAFVLGRHISL